MPKGWPSIRRRVAALAALSPVAVAAAEPAGDTLTGDWGGLRGRWAEAGVTTHLQYKGTVMADVAGGRERGSDYMQNLELKVALDTAKLWNIPDSSAFVHVILNSGGRMNSAYVGSLMGVDNTEAAADTAKLYQAWFSRSFFGNALSALAGVYPLDAEFYVTDSSGVFTHPSFGMAAEVAQTGKHGPSIYPHASLGFRLKYQATPWFYAQAAVVDADPGNARHPHWTRPDSIRRDGTLSIVEIGSRPGEAHHEELVRSLSERVAILTPAEMLEERYEPVGKYAIGYWSYSRRFEAPFGEGPPTDNRGAYVLMENSLFRSTDASTDVAAFLRYGRATEEANVFRDSTSIGLRIRGLFAGRVDDFLGLGVTRSRAGAPYRRAQEAAGIAAPPAETAIEATYRAQLKPWLVLQPVIERIVSPGLDPAIRNATVIGVRCEASL